MTMLHIVTGGLLVLIGIFALMLIVLGVLNLVSFVRSCRKKKGYLQNALGAWGWDILRGLKKLSIILLIAAAAYLIVTGCGKLGEYVWERWLPLP